MKFNIWKNSIQDERLQNILCSFGGDVQESLTYEPGADVDVIFGSWKDRDVDHHNLKRQVVKQSKNVVVIETPLLNRGPVLEVMGDDWFRVGLNGFMRNAQYVPLDTDRETTKLLGSFDKPSNQDYILVVLQLPGDASLDFIDINKWCVDTVDEIRKYTDRDIVIRYPQLDRSYSFKIENRKNVFYQKGTHKNKKITLDNAYAVVTYSSGMGVESIYNGVKTFIQSPNGFWSKQTSLEEVLKREYTNFDSDDQKNNWDNLIGSTQWSKNEIESGKCKKEFEKLLNG